MPMRTLYLCAHGPAYHLRVTLLDIPADVFAGLWFTGLFGGNGVNLEFSVTPAVLFHLRSNMVVNQSNIVRSVQKQLCSSCSSSDELVQFEEPKIDMCCPYSITSFSWFSPACARILIGIPAMYIRSMFHASQSLVASRYCCGSEMTRTGTPRFLAAIIASVWRASVMRYMITLICCVSSLYLLSARFAYDSCGGKLSCESLA